MQSFRSKQKLDEEDYEGVAIIGQGTYGVVKKVRHKKNNQFYAIKCLKLENEKEGVPSTALREIAILKSLDHPNIVKIIQVLCKDYK